MARRRLIVWIALAAGVFWATSLEPSTPVLAQPSPQIAVPVEADATASSPTQAVPAEVLSALPAIACRIVERPTLCVRGPAETFRGKPDVYQWLLDHPDQAVSIWRRLGAKCMDITDQGGGRFGWNDGQGSTVRWETVYRGPQTRVWYAEGTARPSPVLPAVPARAVVVLHIVEGRDLFARPFIKHQADLFLQTDSKTALLIARLLGLQVPRLAEQGVGQMEIFFSALAWYLERHPERAKQLLADCGLGEPAVRGAAP